MEVLQIPERETSLEFGKVRTNKQRKINKHNSNTPESSGPIRNINKLNPDLGQKSLFSLV